MPAPEDFESIRNPKPFAKYGRLCRDCKVHMTAFAQNAYRVLFCCPKCGLKSSVWKPDIARRVEYFADSDVSEFRARPSQDEEADRSLSRPDGVIATVIPNFPRPGGQ